MSNKNKQGQKPATNKDAVPATPKKRGSPKGVLKGPRRIFFSCSAISDNKLVAEEMIFTKPEEATTANASKLFEEKYKAAPAFVGGPYYEVKRAHTGGVSKKSEMLSIPMNKLIPDRNKRFEGDFGGWTLVGMELIGYDDMLLAIWGDLVDPENKKRKPTQTVLRKASVNNIRPLKEEEDTVP